MKIVGSIAAAALLIVGAGLSTEAGAQARHNVVVHKTVVHKTVVRHPVAHRRMRHCTTRWVNHHRVRRCWWR